MEYNVGQRVQKIKRRFLKSLKESVEKQKQAILRDTEVKRQIEKTGNKRGENNGNV